MTVNELLADRGLTSALIIDDAYDLEPMAKDLAADDDAWSQFIADIQAEHEAIVGIFPAYDELSSEQLRTSDEFVSAVWKAKGRISDANWNILFDDYMRATESDKRFLKALQERLETLGITTTTCGRKSAEGTLQTPIIFADLFLGSAQNADDIDESVNKIRTLLKGRENDPPVVILMSRTERLHDKKAYFRDNAGLLGALFRVSNKTDLIADSNLEKILRRMAQHRPDALRVARFLKSWEDGLENAKKDFLVSVRRLDLSDYVQVRQVLLNFEGQPLGSYLLDVFDRVLQYEIEGNNGTIAAAEELNNIDSDSYAVPYIAKSPDLQHLVYRTISQNPERLKVRATECGAPVSFGDILVRTRPKKTEKSPEPGQGEVQDTEKTCGSSPVEDIQPADAYLVLTPACDLVREGGASRVLLISGTVSELNSRTWNYRESGALRTPIIELEGRRRVWIKWDAKNLQMLRPKEILALLDADEYGVVARLRESNAIEIQQKVFSTMGRVGLLAPMPATFDVAVRVLYLGTDGTLKDFDVPVLSTEGGVCFVGRDEEGKENTRLILTEQSIDDVMTALSNLDVASVGDAAKRCFDRLKASKRFELDLQRGISVPNPESGYKTITCLKEEATNAKDSEIVGLIARNLAPDKTPPQANAGIVIQLTDAAT
jgi:hypothetical protein